MSLLNRTLTIDGGDITAWAHWQGTAFPRVDEFKLPRRKGLNTMIKQLDYMWDKFDDLLNRLIYFYIIDKVIIEDVEFWEGSLKSRTAAIRGDTRKLTLLIGGYVHITHTHRVEAELLPARAWKGQLTKEATVERVHRINGMLYPSDHITDAVGMGFSRDVDLWKLKRRLTKKESQES